MIYNEPNILFHDFKKSCFVSYLFSTIMCHFFYHIQLPQPAHKKDKEDELNKVCIETNLYFYC